MSNARTIVGYGASTMQGVGDTRGGFFARMTRELAVSHPDWRLTNLGIGGNTTRDMLKRIDKVRLYEPFTSVIALGCNDLPRERDGNPQNRTTVEEYAANLQAMFKELHGKGSLFISSFPPDPVRTGVQVETMNTYMGLALSIARAYRFEVWDLYAEMLGNPVLPTYWATDGMHFNDVGHAFLAERTLKLILG